MNITKDEVFKNLPEVGAPTPIKQETITVSVSAETFLKDYAKAFVNEARRVLPLVAEQEGALTTAEMEAYAAYLMTQRIKAVNLDCPDWRKLKILWIPSFIQFTLSCIGEVIDRDNGIKFVPIDKSPSKMTFDEARVISDKIGMYQEKLQMVKDAMPRGVEGDKDVMMSAIIDGYVRTTQKVSHPSFTYVTAFWDMHLVEEMTFKALYRQNYDDVEFIRSALIAYEGAII